jgi:hypothetical protein
MYPVPDLPSRRSWLTGRGIRPEVARTLESVAPGAFASFSLASSPTKIVCALLGLLGLAAVTYVAIPVFKTLGICWSVKIEVRLMRSRGQGGRGRRRRRRTKEGGRAQGTSRPGRR